MERSKPTPWLLLLGGAVVGVVVLILGWVWFGWRVEVPPGYSLVQIHYWGKDLPEGEILAKDPSYKGVLEEMKPEGRYWYVPWEWRTELVPMVEVPAGQVLVQTRMYGKPIPDERLATGDFLARDGERGIVGDVLRPGKYRLNKYAYRWELRPVTHIDAGQVGVCTLKVGTDPTDVKGDKSTVYVVPKGTRGVQRDPLPSGDFYINPYVMDIVPVDTRSHPVEFTDIDFPSKDGFHLKPHVTVTFKVLEEDAPELFVTLSNDGKLLLKYNSPEEIAKNPVLQKVVLPLIRGYVRLEGSKMEARDFVAQSSKAAAGDVGNPRERLQKKLMDKVAPPCRELGIVIESITIGDSEKDIDLKELADQIAQRETERLKRETNEEVISKYKQQEEEAAKKALAQQEKESVEATTELNTANKKAEERKQVAESKMKSELEAAKHLLEAAKKEAKSTVTLAEADADNINKSNEAEVAGLKAAVQGFTSADQYAQYQVLLRLAPSLKEVFASDTSDFAKLFSGYMTPSAGKSASGASGRIDKERPAPPVGPAGDK